MNEHKSLRLRIQQEDDLLFVEKVPGFNTHAADVGQWGMFELLKEQLNQELFVVHRLDKGTSGALLFAKSRESTAAMVELFAKKLVRKRYLFVTDRKHKETSGVRSSFIEKKGNEFTSDPDSATPNAKTAFKHLKKLKIGDLWEAFPETGKPHQIRLHAADFGIPILGDDLHGGSAFERLCLHSKSLTFPWKGSELSFETPNPSWASDIEPHQAVIMDAIESRAALFDLSQADEECLRLIHRETEFCRIDQYGPQWWVSWYDDIEPTTSDLRMFEVLAEAKKKSIYIQRAHNRGKNPTAKDDWSVGDVQTRWQALENGVRYELRTDQGLSAGLFLDQRENRHWVRENSRDKKVLNLFSYTGGFSVCAALGGAKEVCTVDVSAKFNDWAKRNFELNGLDPAKAGTEFWAQDCLLFLKGAIKRQRKWNLIVCDPPSFGRSKDGTFQLQKHLPQLLEMCLASLEKGGQLLLSSNYEGWTLADLQKQVFVYRSITPIEVLATPRAGLDFERPGEEPLMKSLIVLKK